MDWLIENLRARKHYCLLPLVHRLFSQHQLLIGGCELDNWPAPPLLSSSNNSANRPVGLPNGRPGCLQETSEGVLEIWPLADLKYALS